MEKSLVLISLQRTQKKGEKERKTQAETEREKCAQQRPHTHTQRHTLYLSLSPSRTHTQLLNNRFFFVTFQLISSFFVDFWVDFYFSTNPPTHSQRVSVADSSQHGTPSDFVTPSAHLHTPRPLSQPPSSTILFHFFFCFSVVFKCCFCCYCCLAKDIDYICVLFTVTKCCTYIYCIYYIVSLVSVCLFVS